MKIIIEEIDKNKNIATRMEGFQPDDPACYTYDRWQNKLRSKGIEVNITEASQLEHERAHAENRQHSHGGR